MPIAKYSNLATYNSATKSTTESNVSFIQDGTGIKIDGINVIVSNPSVGDILFLDANGNIRWIKCDTFQSSSFPSGCTTVGVCFKRQGSKCWVVNKNNTGKKWSEIFEWIVTGYNLDGASHTVTFTMNGSTFNNAFTYSATTVSDFISQLNTYFSTAANFADDHLKNGSFVARLIDGSVHLYCLNFYTWQQEYLGTSGLTLAPNVGKEIDEISWIVRNNKAQSWGGANFKRFKEYASANGRTPTSNEGLKTTDWPVTLDAFTNSSYCSLLRTTYGDYDTYIKSCMAIYPYTRGAMTLSDGKSQTSKLANVTYLDASGNANYKYSAARYCYGISYNHTSLESGKWWLPSLPELGLLMSDITYGLSGIDTTNCDRVNRSLSKIGNTVSVSSGLWSSSRDGWGFSWYYGGGGGFGGNGFHYGFIAVPFTLLKINN